MTSFDNGANECVIFILTSCKEDKTILIDLFKHKSKN